MSDRKLILPAQLDSKMSERFRVLVPQMILPFGVAALLIGFSIADARVISAANLLNILQQSSFLFLFALAQTIVIIARGFDLSLGPTASLVSVGTALALTSFMTGHGNGAPVVIAGLAVGCVIGALVGAFNGAIVAFGRITPFVVTLGSYNIATGLATTISGGNPVQGMPDLFFTLLSSGSLLGVPAPVLIAIAAGLVIYSVLKHTVFGRSLYLIGTNKKAADVAGIPTRYILIAAYVLSSLLTALGAMILTARTGSGEPGLGGALALQSAAAAVVGGASFAGGTGGVGTALLGSVFIIILSNGMNMLEISGYVQMIVLGIIVILGVCLDRLKGRTR